MSYARFGPASDVYVFLNCGGYLDCCACSLGGVDDDDPRFDTTAEMIEHLRAHQAAGYDVPADAFERLERDREENDRWIMTYNMMRGNDE